MPLHEKWIRNSPIHKRPFKLEQTITEYTCNMASLLPILSTCTSLKRGYQVRCFESLVPATSLLGENANRALYQVVDG